MSELTRGLKIRIEQIDCEFERLDGYLFNPHGEWDPVLESEYGVTSRLGLDVRRFERVPGLHFDTGPCLRFARQAQFHPLKYLAGLTRALDILATASGQSVPTRARSTPAPW